MHKWNQPLLLFHPFKNTQISLRNEISTIDVLGLVKFEANSESKG